MADYVVPGTLRIVHHDIAILGDRTPNDESKIAAVGATCATDQGRYWDYAHWVYANQDGENNGGFAPDRLTSIAQAAGVDVSAFPACLDDSARVVAVATTTGDAGNLGISSTPTLAINGQLLKPGLPTTAALGGLIEAAAASAAPNESQAAARERAPERRALTRAPGPARARRSLSPDGEASYVEASDLEAVRGPVEPARGCQPPVDRDALAHAVGERRQRRRARSPRSRRGRSRPGTGG